MISTDLIHIQRTDNSRLPGIDFNELKFGRTFSDHMFMMDFQDGKWSTPQISPFQNLSMSPATSVIHYGQSIFEGLKAFKNENGQFGIFRPDRNIERMNKSALRMCMPQIPVDIFKEALRELVRLDNKWIPTGETSSLYIRPVFFATDEFIGVKASETYRLLIFTSPVNAYYTQPVKVKLETHFTRAARGGTGMAKAAGNYAGSLYPARLGNEKGFDQLLWTDSKEHKYIEESGTMNVMFLINGTLITPELSDTILDGVTRRSIIETCTEWGVPVEERRVAVEEVIEAIRAKTLQEAFGCGTAATIAQIRTIGTEDEIFELPSIESREISNRLSKFFVDLKKFRIPDPNRWMEDLS